MNETPKVTSPKHIVGNFRIERVDLEISAGKRNAEQGTYWGPGLAIHPEMMSGEQRSPIIITPQMVFPLIAHLAAFGAVAAGDSIDQPEPTEPAEPDTEDYKRRDGETREEWTARIANGVSDRK